MSSRSILEKTVLDKGKHKSTHPGIGNSQEEERGEQELDDNRMHSKGSKNEIYCKNNIYINFKPVNPKKICSDN